MHPNEVVPYRRQLHRPRDGWHDLPLGGAVKFRNGQPRTLSDRGDWQLRDEDLLAHAADTFGIPILFASPWRAKRWRHPIRLFVRDRIVAFADLYPSACDACGIVAGDVWHDIDKERHAWLCSVCLRDLAVHGLSDDWFEPRTRGPERSPAVVRRATNEVSSLGPARDLADGWHIVSDDLLVHIRAGAPRSICDRSELTDERELFERAAAFCGRTVVYRSDREKRWREVVDADFSGVPHESRTYWTVADIGEP